MLKGTVAKNTSVNVLQPLLIEASLLISSATALISLFSIDDSSRSTRLRGVAPRAILIVMEPAVKL